MLRNRASDAETILHCWQFKLLRSLLVGSKLDKGALQEIYDSANKSTKGTVTFNSPLSTLKYW